MHFSQLGISHLFAISGFHLGILLGIIFFLIKKPYTHLQNRFFPFRDAKTDTLIIATTLLFFYLLFLNTPPSLLRAYGMFVVGVVFYIQGVEIISMQTLFVTIALLLGLFPPIAFSLGFWLSVAGVFYIFLFLQTFQNLTKIKTFLLLNLWIYLAMLPISIRVFQNFTPYHPFSIFLSITWKNESTGLCSFW